MIKKFREGDWIRIDSLYQKSHQLCEDPTLFYCGRSIPPDDWQPGEWVAKNDERVSYRCGDCKKRRSEWLRIPPPKKPSPMSLKETQRLEMYRRMLKATDVTAREQ